MEWTEWMKSTYNSSRRYGAEEKDAFNPTLIAGLAEAHREWRYVAAKSAPERPHGRLKTPILSADNSEWLRISCTVQGQFYNPFAVG